MSEAKTKTVLWKKALGLLVVLVLLADTLLLWQMSSVVMRVDKYNQGVIDEVGGVVGDVNSFGEDLNEIRHFLLLPEKNYGSENATGEQENGSDVKENSQNELGAYAFLNALTTEKKQSELRAKAAVSFDQLLKSEDLKNVMASGLAIAEQGDLQIKFKDNQANLADGTKNDFYGQPLYNLVFVAEKNAFRVQGALGEQDFTNYSEANWTAGLATYLKDNMVKVREKKKADLAKQSADQQKANDEVKALQEAQKKELDDLIRDKAFSETIRSIGLSPEGKPIEDSNRYSYRVLDANGKLSFTLMLEKSTGMIKVVREDGQGAHQEIDIRSFLNTDEGSKKKP